MQIISKGNERKMKRPKIVRKIGYGFYCILMIVIAVLGFILYNLGNWVLDTWGVVVYR